MVSWWGWEKHFYNEQVKISDIEILNAYFGPSGSFGYIIMSIFIASNKYKDIITNLCSKPTHFHSPVHNTENPIKQSCNLPWVLLKKISIVFLRSLDINSSLEKSAIYFF